MIPESLQMLGRAVPSCSPGAAVRQQLDRGEQLVFFGACTPFHNLLLRRAGGRNAWISSFELASMMGERDDESIGFAEVNFFVERIHRACPDLNMFVDCDTGWSADPAELERYFAALSGKAALVSIQNLPPGQKENSFLLDSAGRLSEPQAMACRLAAVARGFDGLVVLRLENNILGDSRAKVVGYLERLREFEAPFDILLFHHRGSDIEPLESFAESFYDLYPQEVRLATVATAFARAPDLLQRLYGWNYRLVVLPNYSIRLAHRSQLRLYRDLCNGDFEKTERTCSAMADVIDLIYGPTAGNGRTTAEPMPPLHLRPGPPGRNLIFSPGPVNVPEEVRQALMAGDFLHRERAFQSVLLRTSKRLVELLHGSGTHEAVLLGASGTGANEAIIASLHGKALVLCTGRYSERLCRIIERYRIPLQRLRNPSLQPIDLERVGRTLRRNPKISHIVVVHHETTTGILAPLHELGQLAAEYGKLLVVDGISSIGGHSFDLLADNVAFCSVTPNKCLESFPGISYVIGRSEELAKLAGRSRSYYLDLYASWQAARVGEVVYTPAVQAVFALDIALERLIREGYRGRVERYRGLAQRMRSGLESAGFDLVPIPAISQSNIITLVAMPRGMEFHAVAERLRRRGITVYSDEDTLRQGRFFVATMGDMSLADVDRFVDSLVAVLAELGVDLQAGGKSLRAAEPAS